MRVPTARIICAGVLGFYAVPCWVPNTDWTLTPLPGEPETFLLSLKERGGSPSEMNTEHQAEQEAVISKYSVASFRLIEGLGQLTKNLWLWDLVAFKFADICAQWRAEFTPIQWLNTSLLIYFYVECLEVLHCIMSSLSSFSVLHACFCYFICAYRFHFTWSAWLFATNLSCQHLDFSMSELQLQLCLDWDQHDWPFMPSIKSVSEHYLVCPMHNMTLIIVLDKDA